MIIACDTSSMVCSVAAVEGSQILFEENTAGAQVHIEKLTPFLEEAIGRSKANHWELSALAVSIGPGSFNGLRIGLATMKGLALSLKLPLIPILSMNALAYQLKDTLNSKARAIIYSHRDFVHFADYDFSQLIDLDERALEYTTWDKLQHEEVQHYFGYPDRAFGKWLDEPQNALIRERFLAVTPSAGAVGVLAGRALGREPLDLDMIEPVYNAKYEAKKWVPPSF